MANYALTANFASFFGRINPSAAFETKAAGEYKTITGLLENPNGPAGILSPTCFLQGSYKQDTAIYSINDVDIVALCQLWQPRARFGSGASLARNEIFRTIARPLWADARYADKVRYGSHSMCVKVDLGIKVEILPAVFVPGNNDPAKEPFRLYRPETGTWEDGFARHHQYWLTQKNQGSRTSGNFKPCIKVIKHLRSFHNLDTISFHIECVLYALPDDLYQGGPADYIAAVLYHISSLTADQWYGTPLVTPCNERKVFTAAEWSRDSWNRFHQRVRLWASLALAANAATTKKEAIETWQLLLGRDRFPTETV